MKKRYSLLAATILAVSSWLLPVSAQGPAPVQAVPGGKASIAPTPPTARQSPIALSVWPQATQRPDLKYQLLPRYEETFKGNAAIKYYEAAKDITHDDSYWTAEDTLRYCPLKDMDEKLAANYLQQYSTPFHMMHDGARMDVLDWESNFRRDGVDARLPGLSVMRGLSNALSVAIRLDIKHHHWAEAQDKLQTGYSMAQQMGHGETLIEVLVGASIYTSMNNLVEEWVSEPGAPNLYWPLTNLPAPLTDCRHAIMFERAMAFVTVPELREMRQGNVTRETWIAFVKRYYKVTRMIDSASADASPKEDWQVEAAAALFAAAEYPRAKQFLIERGATAADVEKMSVAEVVGRHFVQSYEEDADAIFKWHGLPPAQAAAGAKAADDEMVRKPVGVGNMLARIMLPSLGRATISSARPDRQVAMLRTVEAVRAYAAEKGNLPESLSQLTLPVPVDPFTGKPFEYDQDGNKASIISASPTSNPRDAYRYDLTLQK